MKKRDYVLGLAIGVLALALAMGAQTFAKPCAHDRKLITFLTVEGGAAAVLAGLCIIKPNLILTALTEISGLIIILTPGVLVKLCTAETMRCQMITKPTAIVAGVLIAVLALVWLCLLLRDRKRA